MTQINVRIPHRLPTKDHALHKIRTLAAGFKSAYADQFRLEEEVWSVRGCQFVLTTGHRGKRRLAGNLNVHTSYVEIVCEGNIPRHLAGRVERAVESQLGRFLS